MFCRAPSRSVYGMSWWTNMVSAISGDSVTHEPEPGTPPSNPLSPPHPQAHMPTSFTSPNEFGSSSPPIAASAAADPPSSTSNSYWSMSTLTSTLASTSSGLTEMYKVHAFLLKPLSFINQRNTFILQRDILTFASSLTEEVRAHRGASCMFF